MSEPGKDNARLAERLSSIALALAKPNGHAPEGLTDEVLTALAKGIVPYVRSAIAEATAPLKQENAKLEECNTKLEARLIALEQRPTIRYCGVWDPLQTYFIGDFCTDDGSLWHCDHACTGVRPPDDKCWTLAVKRGRDGKR